MDTHDDESKNSLFPLGGGPGVWPATAGQRCDPTGVSVDPNIPIIAGQSPVFITYALKAFAADVWPSTAMGEIAKSPVEGNKK